MCKLNHELLRILVPLLCFPRQAVKGTSHLDQGGGGSNHGTPARHTSGLAVPTFIINAPHGYGKIPIGPNYLIGMGKDYLTIRTWENRIMRYDNRELEEKTAPDSLPDAN